jgi:coenzyme F420-reducing hydrogenase gamma subunit
MIQLSLWQKDVTWYRNEYLCGGCGTEWADEWSCQCNDRCPTCDLEIEPMESYEIEPDTDSKMLLAIQDTNEEVLSRLS